MKSLIFTFQFGSSFKKYFWFLSDDMRGQLTLNETEFTNRCSVLKRYVDANIDREKQVLYALQHLMHQMEHPNSEYSIFILYLWKNNNDFLSPFFQDCCSISSIACTTMMWYPKKALTPGLHARIQQSRRARAWPPNLPTISSRGCAKTMTMKAKTKSEKKMIFQQFFKKTARKKKFISNEEEKNCRRSRFIRKKNTPFSRWWLCNPPKTRNFFPTRNARAHLSWKNDGKKIGWN